MIGTYAGMRVISDPNALEKTKERLFPESRHRSKRVLKKLIKRHGGEFRMQPCAFQIGRDTLVMHPTLYQQLVRELAAQERGFEPTARTVSVAPFDLKGVEWEGVA